MKEQGRERKRSRPFCRLLLPYGGSRHPAAAVQTSVRIIEFHFHISVFPPVEGDLLRLTDSRTPCIAAAGTVIRVRGIYGSASGRIDFRHPVNVHVDALQAGPRPVFRPFVLNQISSTVDGCTNRMSRQTEPSALSAMENCQQVVSFRSAA